MAWLEYQDGVGAGWRLTIVDGRIKSEAVEASSTTRHRHYRPDGITVDDIAEIACETRRQARPKYHRQIVDKGMKVPYCDFFVLQPSARQKPTGDAAPLFSRAPSSDVADDAVYLLQVERGCPFYADCMNKVIKAVGMESLPESARIDFPHYRRWAQEFAEDLLVPYVAPCRVAEERIRHRGFQCSSE